jgi:hypothetical protein
MGFGGVITKMAGKHANIGGIDLPIHYKGASVSGFLFFYPIGHGSNSMKVIGTIESNSVFKG